MAELFLVAHKVRGEPAFDIAERQRCPICKPMRQGLDDGSGPLGCDECEDGFWWIVSTSGHRAYPILSWPLDRMFFQMNSGVYSSSMQEYMKHLPDHSGLASLPDHYPTRQSSSPSFSPKALLAKLGLMPKVQRRL